MKRDWLGVVQKGSAVVLGGAVGLATVEWVGGWMRLAGIGGCVQEAMVGVLKGGPADMGGWAIGAATVLVLTEQVKVGRRLQEVGERQTRIGEKQNEIARRQGWLERWEKRHAVVKGVVEFYSQVARGTIEWADVQMLSVVVIGRGMTLFRGGRREWLMELGRKAKAWWHTEQELRDRGDSAGSIEKRKELEEWLRG